MDEARFILENGRGWEGHHEISDGGVRMSIFTERPDFLVYPYEEAFSDLAGRRGSIVEERHQLVRCPVCKTEGNRTVWSTEHGVEVILCSGCKQYIWTRRKAEEKGEK